MENYSEQENNTNIPSGEARIQLDGQLDGSPPSVEAVHEAEKLLHELELQFNVEWSLLKQREICLYDLSKLIKQMKGEGVKLDLENKPQDALDWKGFLSCARRSVRDIRAEQIGALLALGCSFLIYQAKNMSTLFGLQFENTSNITQSQLSFGESFAKFFPEMVHILLFILCYFGTLMLVLLLQLGLQIIIFLPLVSAPFYYFPELVRKSSGVKVSCGLLNVPLIWFTTLGALGLALICGLLTLTIIYLTWRYIYEGTPTEKELKVSSQDLSKIWNTMN